MAGYNETRDTAAARVPTGFKLFIKAGPAALPAPPAWADSAWTGDGWTAIPSFDGGPNFADGLKTAGFRPAEYMGDTNEDIVEVGNPTFSGTIQETALDTFALFLASALKTTSNGVRSLAMPKVSTDIPMFSAVLLGYVPDPITGVLVPGGYYYPYCKQIGSPTPKVAQGKNRTFEIKFKGFVADNGTYITEGTAVKMFDVPASSSLGGVIPVATLMTVSAAQTALASAGFSTTSQIIAASSAVASGYVSAQSPAAGVSRLYATVMALTVSSGPA